MKIIRIVIAFSLVVAGVISTVGSGGGGSWDSCCFGEWPNTGLDPSPITWVNITSSNALDVSAEVVQAVHQMFDVAATMGGQVFPNPLATPNVLSGHSKFVLFDTVVASGEPVTDACAVSGTVTLSGNPTNDPVAMSVNDAFSLVFDSCDDGDGYSIDGGFSLKVMELSGDPWTDVFRIRYSLWDIELTVASDGGNYTASANGFALARDSLAFPVIALTSSFYSLQLSSLDDVYFIASENLSLTANVDISPINKVLEASTSRMKSDFLGDSLSYETILPLTEADNANPESGEILVTGNGTVRIVIESSTSVRLEIDADSDGVVDDYQYTTWAALQGQATRYTVKGVY
jgi:hypothetical protein